MRAVRGGGGDNEAWGVSDRAATVAYVLPLAGLVAVVASRADAGLFRLLTREDSLLEWLQVVCFLAAAVFGAALAARLWRERARWPALAYVAFAAACVFIAGEEIAWGQRIFGIETPEALERVNEQGEVTLHNVEGVLVFFNAGMLLVGLAGTVLPWLAPRVEALRERPWRLFVPPRFLTTAFFVMFAYKAIRFTVLDESRYTIVKIGEWAELCVAAGLAAMAWFIWRCDGRDQPASTGSTLRASHAGSEARPGDRPSVPPTSVAHHESPTTSSTPSDDDTPSAPR